MSGFNLPTVNSQVIHCYAGMDLETIITNITDASEGKIYTIYYHRGATVRPITTGGAYSYTYGNFVFKPWIDIIPVGEVYSINEPTCDYNDYYDRVLERTFLNTSFLSYDTGSGINYYTSFHLFNGNIKGIDFGMPNDPLGFGLFYVADMDEFYNYKSGIDSVYTEARNGSLIFGVTSTKKLYNYHWEWNEPIDITSNLQGCNFSSLKIDSSTKFYYTNMTATNFSNSDFNNVRFEADTLNNSSFTNMTGTATFNNCSLVGSYFNGSKTVGVNYDNCDLTNVVFDYAVLKYANFSNCTFYHNNFRGTDLTGCTIINSEGQQITKVEFVSLIGGSNYYDVNTKWIDGTSL